MAASPASSKTPAAAHPITDVVLNALRKGDKEKYELDDKGAVALATALSELRGADKLRAALTALVEVAHVLAEEHKSPTVANALIRLVSIAAEPLKAEAAAPAEDKASGFNKFSGKGKTGGASTPAPPDTKAGASKVKMAAPSSKRRA